MEFRRLAAWSGIGFVVLILIATFAPAAAPPSLDDSATKVASYFADKHDQLIIGNVANTVATLLATIFLVGVYSLLRERDGTGREPWALVGLVGAILVGAVVTMGQAMSSLAILRAGAPGEAKFLSDLAIEVFTLAGILIAVNLLGFSMAITRSRALPSWTAGLGFVTAAVGTIGAFSAGMSNDLLNIVGFAAFILFLLWVLLVAIVLLRPAAGASTP
jgi:hypothetical protein